MDKVKQRANKENAMEKLPAEIEKVGFKLGLSEKAKVDALRLYDKYRGSVDDHVKVTQFSYSFEAPKGVFTRAVSNPEIESSYHTRVGLVLAGSALYVSSIANSIPIVSQSIEEEFRKLHKRPNYRIDDEIDLFMAQRILDTSIAMMKWGKVVISPVDFVEIHLQGLMNRLSHRLQSEQAQRITQDAQRVVEEMKVKLKLSVSGTALRKQHLAMAATAVYIAMKNDDERISHEELGEDLGITHGGMFLYRKCVAAGMIDVTALGTIFRKMRRASRELGLSIEAEEKAKQILKRASGIEMLNAYNPKEHAEMDRASEAAIWMAALDEGNRLNIHDIGMALKNKRE